MPPWPGPINRKRSASRVPARADAPIRWRIHSAARRFSQLSFWKLLPSRKMSGVLDYTALLLLDQTPATLYQNLSTVGPGLQRGCLCRAQPLADRLPGRWAGVRRSAPAHRLNEFPAGYSLAGCSPAEPASASPAEEKFTMKAAPQASFFQRAHHVAQGRATSMAHFRPMPSGLSGPNARSTRTDCRGANSCKP